MSAFLVVVLLVSGCSREEKVRDNVYLEDRNVSGMKREQVKEIIENYAKEINVEPKEGGFNVRTGDTNNEVSGKKVNIEKTLEAVFEAEPGDRVKLVVEDITPNYIVDISEDKKDIVEKQKLDAVEIGSATTPLLNKTKSRVNNIRQASQQLDHMEILPGEEFSFNGELGKRTKDKGYEKAPIIVRTENGPKTGYGTGGGICQVSSTLYNAVREAGLKVTERHSHSKDVGYVKRGNDATVVYGGPDFKFINNRPNPIVIRTFLSEDSLTIKIYDKID